MTISTSLIQTFLHRKNNYFIYDFRENRGNDVAFSLVIWYEIKGAVQMSDKVTFKIAIPSDNEGFVLMQCENCGEYFKCTSHDIESDEILHIYCPSCGLISQSYFTENVIQLANAMITNYGQDTLYDFSMKMERQFSNNKFEKYKAGCRPKKTYEPPIYSTIEDLVKYDYRCCNRSAKINPLLKMSVSFCPFCGGVEFGDQ